MRNRGVEQKEGRRGEIGRQPAILILGRFIIMVKKQGNEKKANKKGMKNPIP